MIDVLMCEHQIVLNILMTLCPVSKTLRKLFECQNLNEIQSSFFDKICYSHKEEKAKAKIKMFIFFFDHFSFSLGVNVQLRG